MELKCTYLLRTRKGFTNQLYTCKITSASITKTDDRTIKLIEGDHLAGKGDVDVEAIIFTDTVVEVFPRNLHVIFPRLVAVNIDKCGLKEITQEDLAGLENLETIFLQNNQLKSLPSNLFQAMTKLKRISFYNTALEFVSSQLLKPLIKNGLTWVDFRMNGKIDAFYGHGDSRSVATIEKLMEIIEASGKVPQGEEERNEKYSHYAKMVQGFNYLWTSRKLSDFKIIAGEKEFPVHKSVLSIHSKVFAGMFLEQANHSKEFRLRDTTFKAIYNFLRFFYTGELPDAESAPDVLALAFQLKADELKIICERIICQNSLKNSNAKNVFMIGHVNASNKLIVEAFNMIKSNHPNAGFTDDLMQQPEKFMKMVEALEVFENLKQQ